MNRCILPEEFQRLLAEQLSEGERQALDAHVDACARCQESLALLLDDAADDTAELLDWARLGRDDPASTSDYPEDFLRRLKDMPPAETPTSSDSRDAGTPLDIRFPEPATLEGSLGRLESYHILAELGRGAFGLVFKAYDEKLDCPVALKVLKPELAASLGERARFENEARKAAAVRHDHVVAILRVGSTPGFALPYFVMEYIEGESLSERLGRQGVLAPKEAAEVVRQVALGLAAAHARGQVHRDIKPSNILLEKSSGRAKIADFGLARTLDVRDQKLTRSGAIMGTPLYMSPEQITAPHQVDMRSDIYSLGVVLYELLTGEPPFRGLAHMVLQQVVHEEPRPLRRLNDAIGRDLETICQRCLQKEAGKRFPSAEALAEDLRRFLAGEPIVARPVGSLERSVKWARRRPAIAGLLTTVFLVTTLGFAGVFWQWREAVAARSDDAEKAATLEIKRREKEKEAETLQTDVYYKLIALAEREHNRRIGSRADELLDQCPPRLRGWEWHYLKRFPFANFQPLRHNAFVIRVAFGADGRQLAAGDLDGNVTVWDAWTGDKLKTIPAHDGRVWALAFSPDGRYLATGGREDCRAKIWDVSTGRLLPPLEGHTNGIEGFAFSPDGKRLGTASVDGTVRLWNLSSGREILTFDKHAQPLAPNGLAFWADGQRLTSVSVDGVVKVWDSATGETVSTFHGGIGWVASAAFSGDGRWLALGGENGTVKVYQTDPWKEVRALEAHASLVHYLALSPDGLRLASTGEDRTVKIWDVATGHEALLLDIHSGKITSLAFSPDGHRLASGSADNTVKVSDGTPWVDLEQGEPGTAHDHKVVEVAFFGPDQDSQRLISASWDRTVKIWDLNAGERGVSAPRLVRTVHGLPAGLTGVALSGDGQRFAASSLDGTVTICDVHSGKKICTLQGKPGPVYGVAFNPRRNELASAHFDGTVNVWDIADIERRRVEEGNMPKFPIAAHADAVLGVTYSADGQLLASAGGRDQQNNIGVWEAATGKEINRLYQHGFVRSVAFSPNAQFLACANSHRVEVVDWKSERELFKKPLGDRAFRAVFSPDGKRLATVCEGQTVQLLDAVTGDKLGMLRVSGGELWGVAFSPDGRSLATCSGYKGKGTIQIWDRTLWDVRSP